MKRNCTGPGHRAIFMLSKANTKKGGIEMPRNGKIEKAFAITNAKISFVSLVDKAANKRQFVVIKADKGEASFQTFGRVLKADSEAHYVTGVVYEPMVEDTQGNYMTADEILKAAYGYAKNGMSADLQHNFEKMEGATVVESYVAKCDETIEGQEIKKGTWVMTMEITNDSIWDAIQKGEITGFSMGGVGQYSEEDVDLDSIEKAETPEKKKSIFKSIAAKLGFDVVEKGAVIEQYNRTSVRDNFWNAYYALSDVLLDSYDPETRTWGPEKDVSVVNEALSDFTEIIKTLMENFQTGDIFKSEDGKGLKPDTIRKLQKNVEGIAEKFDNEEEEEMTKQDMEALGEIIKNAVAEGFAANKAEEAPVTKACSTSTDEKKKKKACAKSSEEGDDGVITKADVEAMIEAAIRKATGEEEEEEEEEGSDASLETIVQKAVAVAMTPFMAQAGLPTNLNDTSVQKSEETQHYLHGYL